MRASCPFFCFYVIENKQGRSLKIRHIARNRAPKSELHQALSTQPKYAGMAGMPILGDLDDLATRECQ